MIGRLVAAVFLVLHGLVHLWYVVLSQGWIEIEAEMGWGGRSWLFSSVLAEETVLVLASLAYLLVTIGFVLGGIGLAFEQTWWTAIVVGAAVLSTLVIVTMWNGEFELLIEQGAAGVLINIGLLGYVLVMR